MNVEGTHQFGNLNTGAKSQTQIQDNRQGQYSTFANTNNAGQFSVQGNHQFENTTNNGQFSVRPRAYNAEGAPTGYLMDLAGFNNYNNLEGGATQIQGVHQFKAMQNQKGGNVNVLDHKAGLASTFGNTNNMGNMNVSGNHQFDQTQNSGKFVAAPRTFNPDGSPV
jgi:hypothetical protein